jgi:hypothetical protein
MADHMQNLELLARHIAHLRELHRRELSELVDLFSDPVLPASSTARGHSPAKGKAGADNQ